MLSQDIEFLLSDTDAASEMRDIRPASIFAASADVSGVYPVLA
jgi:hypothetical protein